MKKLLACVLGMLLVSCASRLPHNPNGEIESSVASLLQAYQNKDLRAFSAHLAAGYSDRKDLETKLANVFLTYADIRVSNVSIQEIIADGAILHVNVFFDRSFTRQRDETAFAERVRTRQIWHLSFVRENDVLRLISVSKSAL